MFFFFLHLFSAVVSKPRLQAESLRVSSTLAAAAVVTVSLLSPVKAVQVLQDEVVAESILVLRRNGSIWPPELLLLLFSAETFTHQGLHHVGLTVAESFNGVKDVHHVLVLNHLQQNVAGAEGPTAAATITAVRTSRRN